MRNRAVEEFRYSVSETREIVGELSSQVRRSSEKSVRASRAAIEESRKLLLKIEIAVLRSTRPMDEANFFLPLLFLFENEQQARVYAQAIGNRPAQH